MRERARDEPDELVDVRFGIGDDESAELGAEARDQQRERARWQRATSPAVAPAERRRDLVDETEMALAPERRAARVECIPVRLRATDGELGVGGDGGRARGDGPLSPELVQDGEGILDRQPAEV